MKKILIVSLLILALCLSLVACGGKNENPAPSETEAATEAPATKPTTKPTEKPTEKPTDAPAPSDEAPAENPGGNVVQSTQSFEDVVRGYYYTCQSMSDDGIVRDYFTKEPIEFSYSGEDVVWYAYKSGGEYRSVCISPNGVNPETGAVNYQIQWG
ncbi:MAG: hypothetical protein IJJ99_03560 [Oscillospiraceae bacterium]|nr:hypothetical protein [Oscillospiraceae bacterium]